MRMIIGMILLAGASNTALAHIVDGGVATTLGHQLFGLHHLILSAALVALLFYLGRSWYRSNRIK
jgi:hypothetical protein